MRIPTALLITVIVSVAAGAFARAVPEAALRKDKAALILYGGFLDSPILIDRADTANLVDIALLRTRGQSVPPENLSARPCVGLALFTKDGWSALQGRAVESIRPEMAQLRVRLYPAFEGDSAVVYDPLGSASIAPGGSAQNSSNAESRSAAWIASGAPYLKRTSIPVESPPAGPVSCNVTP